MDGHTHIYAITNAGTALHADVEEVAVSQLQDVTNTDTLPAFATPPPMAQSKASPQGPTTRSKSARKVRCSMRLF